MYHFEAMIVMLPNAYFLCYWSFVFLVDVIHVSDTNLLEMRCKGFGEL